MCNLEVIKQAYSAISELTCASVDSGTKTLLSMNSYFKLLTFTPHLKHVARIMCQHLFFNVSYNVQIFWKTCFVQGRVNSETPLLTWPNYIVDSSNPEPLR